MTEILLKGRKTLTHPSSHANAAMLDNVYEVVSQNTWRQKIYDNSGSRLNICIDADYASDNLICLLSYMSFSSHIMCLMYVCYICLV